MSGSWIADLETDEEGRRILEQERLIIEVTEAIATVMAEHGISRTELAQRLGKTQPFVTKLLRGDNNFTLRTLSDVFSSMGYAAHLTLGDLGGGVVPCDIAEASPLLFPLESWNRSHAGWPERGREFSDSPTDDGGIAA